MWIDLKTVRLFNFDYSALPLYRALVSKCESMIPRHAVLTAYIRESNGVFGSGDFVPGSNIATSTNTINADDLDSEIEDVEFTFNDIELVAGTYCIVIMAFDENFGNGAVVMPIMESGGSSQLGAPAWWSYYDQVWYSWNED